MLNKSLFFFLAIALLQTACVSDVHAGGQAKNDKLVTPQNSKTGKPGTFRVNIFIENSASMDGYVNRVTEFQQAIYALAADLQSSHMVSEINFYYVNGVPLPAVLNAKPTQVASFLNQISPEALRQNSRSKLRGESDLKGNLELALNKVDTRSASIFVSDCIFSPGRRKGNAEIYLKSQETGLKSSFKLKLDSLPFTTQILHYSGLFFGTYFDQNNSPIHIPYKERPFYMIAMGPSTLLSNLLSEKNLSGYKSRGYQNEAVISPTSVRPVTAKMTYKYRLGQYTIKAPASKLVINEASPSSKGRFRFSVAADLSSLDHIQNDLMPITEHEISPGFKLDSIVTVKSSSVESLKGATHLFVFSAQQLQQSADVTFRLFRRIPDWVAQTSSQDDRELIKKGQLNQTFGLSYLVNGINSAYQMSYDKPQLLTLQMQVNSTESNDSDDAHEFNWLLVLIPIAIITIIIVAKTRK